MPPEMEFATAVRTPEEQEALGRIVRELKESKGHRSPTLDALCALLYERKPVDIKTFIESKDYLNKAGQVWPIWMNDLVRLFHDGDKYLAIMRGGIGTGKTTSADIALCYILYQLSCLKDPAQTYGLMGGSTVALICVSVNLTQAKRVLFKRLRAMLEDSPYFKEHFPFNVRVASELRFPNQVWLAPVASNEQNVIGENVFGGVIDEGNFMPVIEGSKRSREKGGVYDRAQVLFNALRRRMKSRFPGMPGKFIVVSSEQYPDDFVDRICREYKDDPGVQIMHYSQWETRPKNFYSGATFKIEVGNELRSTRILRGDEQNIGGEVMEVPIELKKEFELDPDGATRDIAGRSTLALTPFITRRETIRLAIDKKRLHPVDRDSTTLVDGYQVLWDRLAKYDPIKEQWVLKHHPGVLRFAHFDQSLTTDFAGAAIGCCGGWKEVLRPVKDENEVTVDWVPEKHPIIWYDLILRIEPPEGEQINLARVRQILYDFVAHGFRFRRVSFDSFASVGTIQTLQEKGYDAVKLSVDTDITPYVMLRQGLYEARVNYYEYTPALEELPQLEHVKIKKKVDHPPKGCLAPETRVVLLDGTEPTIAEVARRYGNGEELWTLASTTGGRLAPSRITWAGVTRQDAEMVDVLLDDWSVVRCTPDHRFLTWEGEWIRADEMVLGTRLMPLYRSTAIKGGWANYVRVCTKGERQLLHQLVYRGIHGAPARGIIHHDDGNKLNNNPWNLLDWSKSQHGRYETTRRHREDPGYNLKVRLGAAAYARSPEGRQKSSETIQRNMQRLLEGRRGVRTSRQLNHRVVAVRPAPRCAEVYDLTVPGLENFALGVGIFAHNSKDVADAMAGVAYWVSTISMTEPVGLISSTTEEALPSMADPRDRCKTKGCPLVGEVYGHCRKHFSELEESKREEATRDPSELIWTMPGEFEG